MDKTIVYLDAADARRLATLADREGVSQATLLRKAIRAYVPQRPEDHTFALDSAGQGPSGSIADMDMTIVLKGFGG